VLKKKKSLRHKITIKSFFFFSLFPGQKILGEEEEEKLVDYSF